MASVCVHPLATGELGPLQVVVATQKHTDTENVDMEHVTCAQQKDLLTFLFTSVVMAG